MSNVLFFHQSNLLIESSANIGGGEISHVHIVVHGLLFRCRDYHGRKYGGYVRSLGVYIPFDVVHGVSMLRYGRSTGHNFGVSADQPLRVYSLCTFQKICVSIQMIEVFKQSKVQRGFYVTVGLSLCKFGSQIHRQLLVRYGVFQYRLVARL